MGSNPISGSEAVRFPGRERSLLESRAMKTSRKLLVAALGSFAIVVLAAEAAAAQSPVDPSTTPEINKSNLGPLGPYISLAGVMLGLAVLLVVLLTVLYLRYSPR